MGTPVLPGQIPWMSGSPHGVLGGVHVLEGACCAVAGTANAIRAASAPSKTKRRWLIFTSLLFELAIEQLFGELHALEFQQLRIFFRAAIQGQTYFPRTREDPWIV